MKKLFVDFDLFCRALVATKDVDPTYMIIPKITQHYGFEPVWFCFVYVSFYSLESAIKICEEMPSSAFWNANKFKEMRNDVKKFGIERRGSQRNVDNQILHLRKVVEYMNDELFVWDSNQKFRADIQKNIPLVGGWASFKIAEVLEKSFSFDSIGVPDLGLDGRDPNSNDGPVGGFRWLYGRDNEYDKSIFNTWENLGIKLSKSWGMNIGEVETCFCKFHKLASGKYFVGHDILEFTELEEVVSTPVYKDLMNDFPEEIWMNKHYEKEKKFKRHYKDTGKILLDEYAIQFPEVDVLDAVLKTS